MRTKKVSSVVGIWQIKLHGILHTEQKLIFQYCYHGRINNKLLKVSIQNRKLTNRLTGERLMYAKKWWILDVAE